jgi:hypothetical protein
LLQAQAGARARGRANVERALKQAEAMGRVSLATLAREHLAGVP